MNYKIILIFLFSIIIISLLVTIITYYITLPKKSVDLSKNQSASIPDYLISIYKSNYPFVSPTWYWDTIPQELQKNTPISANLSLQWPPAKGQRFRMTAFPYPDTGKSSFWLFQFIKGMSSLLDNTADQVTFPGWQVSIYDPLNPNDNEWSTFLNSQISWDPLRGSINQTNDVYMEVIHSCYVPPSFAYPYCDDGGYWMYGASGSGIFWASGHYDPASGGGCLVARNKIDAMFKLLGTTDGLIALRLATKDPTMTPIKYMVNALKTSGGGLQLTKAMKTVIDAFHNRGQIPKIIAFRTMQSSKATKGWFSWLFFSILFTIILVVFFGYIVKMIFTSFKQHNNIPKTLLLIVGFMVAVVAVLLTEWSVVTEYMLESFGYMTLDMGLKKTGMTLEQFIYSCAGTYNPISNSLAQIQNFDFDLDTFCNVNKLDSVIMHTQPNKSGSWAVEIMDVRNTPFKKDATSLKDLVYPLGICGQPVQPGDTDIPSMPPLRQGPLVKSDLYFGYQPDLTTTASLCNCDESAVAKQYNSGLGTLKRCTFCEGSISQQLC